MACPQPGATPALHSGPASGSVRGWLLGQALFPDSAAASKVSLTAASGAPGVP